MVYILDIDNNPLMPTERHGHVRRLLRDGKACVVKRTPFTIKLNYQTTTYIQEVSLALMQEHGISVFLRPLNQKNSFPPK